MRLILTMESTQIAAVVFLDIDLIIDRDNAEIKIQEMLKIHNDIYLVTGGHIEDKKCIFFV